MKILIKTFVDEDYLTRQKLIIDGVEKESIGKTEPEDAIIGRDLISASRIAHYMTLAHHATARGEDWEVDEIECETEEEFFES